jgi:ATP-dependent Lon protease
MLAARRVGSIYYHSRRALAPFSMSQKSFWWSGDDDKKDDDKDAMKNPKTIVVDNGETVKQIVLQSGETSPKLSPLVIVPVTRRPIFPGFFATHLIKDEKTIDAILSNRTNGVSYLGLFLRKDDVGSEDPNVELITDLKDVYDTGTFAQIHNVIKTPRGSQLLLMAHRRITLDTITDFGPPTIAKVNHLKSPFLGVKSASVKAYSNEVVAAVR